MIDQMRSGSRKSVLLIGMLAMVLAWGAGYNFVLFHREFLCLFRHDCNFRGIGRTSPTEKATIMIGQEVSKNKTTQLIAAETTAASSMPAQFKSNLTYPLSTMNLTSAEKSYLRGFWQRADPVPWARWTAISNITCVVESVTNRPVSGPTVQRRVPFAMILGTQKGGTTALLNYLYSHPSIQRSPVKEFHFFDEIMDQDPNLVSIPAGGIPSELALRFYVDEVIGKTIPLPILEISTHLNIVDATPEYLFCSDRVSHRVLCVSPWVNKFVVLLRNPVDRAFSQYNMQANRDLRNPSRRRGFVTFEEYIEMDMQVLLDVGVIRDRTASDSANDSDDVDQQLEAWKTYTKLGLNSPLGRGLYSIQLRQWFQAMQAYGRYAENEFLVLKSEEMRNDSKAVYTQVSKFLELTPQETTSQFFKPIHTTNYRIAKMNPGTRAKLETFFKPYNKQLEELLGSKWHGVWEY